MKPKTFAEQIQYFSPTVPVNVRWRCGEISGYPLHYHPEYEFQFVKQGQGTYIIAGKPYHYNPGHLIIIRPDQIHSFISKSACKMKKGRLQFKCEWMDNILKQLNFDDMPSPLICLTDKQAILVEMILNRILEENLSRADRWEDMIYYFVHEFLILIHRARKQCVRTTRVNPIADQLCQYIATNYADPKCTVTAVARRFGYSLSYLSALFKEVNQIGMKSYLLQYRIIVARQLLETDPELKIMAIAKQVGFKQYGGFHRVFLMQTGMTPLSYRKFYHQDRKK